MRKLNIDVCAVNETFLRPSIPDSFLTIDGYQTYRRDRKVCNCRKQNCPKAHKGGGVLFYVRSSLTSDVYHRSDICESLWIKLSPQHPIKNQFIFVNSSYHPPGTDGDVLLQYLTSTTNDIEEEYPGSPMFICGDFNRLDLEVLELESGMMVLDSPNTRGNARLDLILTNRNEMIECVSTFKSLIETDHLGILMKPKFSNRPVRKNYCFRLFSHRGHQKLNKMMTEFNFEALYHIDDIHEATLWLENSISSCIDKAFPMKQVKMSDHDPYWMTPKIKWLIKKRQQARRRNETGEMSMLNDKIKSEKVYAIKNRGTRSWWTQIDALTHRKQSNCKLIESAFDPGFLNIELSRRSAVRAGEIRDSPPNFDLRNEPAPELTLYEVAQTLRKCRRTATGPSNIYHFVFRDYWDILCRSYWYLWNKSLANGVFPECYKAANLIPIPKVKNADSVANVRGISVTSIAARLFEKAVHKKWITPRITAIGDPCQFAYKARLSTSDCLLCLQHYVLSALDRSDIDGVHAFMVDFAKAFDRLNQEKAAVSYMQFIDSTHLRKWLYDFSVNRKQRLIWRDQPLEYVNIDRGCSQGTVGGPGIFSMYTDDARTTHENTQIFKYSDDMNCLIPCLKNPSNEDKQVFTEEISNLIEWAKRKDLEVNIKKSKLIRFCLNRRPQCVCFPSSTNFEIVDHAKILGVIFQSDCSFRKHCSKLLSELRSLTFLFKDLQIHHVPLNDIQVVFEAIVISKIRYGLSVYGSDHYSLLKINKFLQRCYEKRFCKTQYNVSELLNQEDKRNLNKILQNPKHPLHSYLISQKKIRTTRHGFQSSKPYVRTKAFLNCFVNRVLPF